MRLFILITLLFFPMLGLGQSEKRVISLSQFLELAEKNDPNFERIVADKAQLNFIVELGLPTRQLLLSAQKEQGIAQGTSEDSSSLSLSATKSFIETGTNVTISQVQTQRPDRDEDVTEFRVRQSLWKNLLGRDVRLKKASLETQKQIIQIQILEAYESYLSDISKSYLDYGQAYLGVQLAEKILVEAKNIQQDVLNRRKKNIATQTDVDRVALQVILAQEDLVKKRAELEVFNQTIQTIVGEGLDKWQPEVTESLSDKFEIRPQKMTVSTTELRAYKENSLRESVASESLTLESRADAPELNLILGQDIDNSTRFSSSVNRDNTIVGLSLQIPIGDSVQKANIRKASLALTTTQLQTKRLQRDLAARLANLRSQLTASQEQLQLSQKKVDLTNRILKDELQRYRRGTLPLDTLIETRKDFSEYRFKYNSDVIEHNKVVIDWLEFTDNLLQKNIF